MNKTFRRFDLWVGRHMSAGRWIAAWGGVTVGGFILSLRVGIGLMSGWWLVLAFLMALLGILGIVGNARRLK